MDEEVLAIFLMNKMVIAMRTFQGSSLGKTVILSWRKVCLTDLAQNLAFLFAIIPHEIVHSGITGGTGAVLWNIAFHTAKNGTNGFVITLFVVRDEILPVPILFIGNDFWKFINLEFLVCRRMGIIKSPLFKWDVSADKMNKPANLFLLVLNKMK